MPDPESLHGYSRLDGLDAGRVLDMVMGPAAREGRDVPAAEELGALLPDYEVQAVIGRGGMGAVYRAVQRKLARPVAIKVLPVEMGDAPGFADRFRREAMTTAGLVHPDIVVVHDTGETVAGHHYYVMDLVDGEDLAKRMERGWLAVEESVALLATICGAVEAAHARGIIHRDIKPSNILLTKEGKPRLADFGLALLTEKHLEYSRLTLGGTTLGTLEYAAPEQLAGNAVTRASDQYSLGVLAYELLTGELPRGVFDPPSARNAEIDPAFDGVVLRALQSDPARRYDSVAEFRAALLNAADRRVQQEHRSAEGRRKLRQRTGIAAVAAGVALLTVGLAVFAWQQRQRAVGGEIEAKLGRDAARMTRAEAEKLVEFMLIELQGRLFEVNRLDVLEEVVARVAAYYDSVPAEDQRDDEFLRRKAEFIELRGALAGKHGRGGEALAFYREAQAIRRDLLTRHRAERTHVNSFLEGEMALAGALAGEGDLQGAWQAHQNIVDVYTAWRGCPVDQATDQMALMSRALQAELLGGMGRHDEARAAAEAQSRRLDALLTDPAYGEEFAYQNVKAIVLRVLARDAWRRGDAAGGADLDRQRMEIYGRFLPVEGRNGYREIMFSEAALTAAGSLGKAGRHSAAEAAAVAAWMIKSRLAEDDPGSASLREDVRAAADAWAAARRARQLPATDELLATAGNAWLKERPAAAPQGDEAGRLQNAERELFDELQANPENDEAQFEWAMASEEAGKHTESLEGIPAAVKHYERQLANLEPLLAAARPDTWWNLGTGYTLNRLGELKERTRDWAGAEPVFRRSLDLRRRTLAAHPDNPRDARNVASTAAHLARAFTAQNRPAEAEALWRELLAELKPVPAASTLEWRALVATSIPETLAVLEPEAASSLAAATREFLLARGEAALSSAEKQSLRALERNGGK